MQVPGPSPLCLSPEAGTPTGTRLKPLSPVFQVFVVDAAGELKHEPVGHGDASQEPTFDHTLLGVHRLVGGSAVSQRVEAHALAWGDVDGRFQARRIGL